MESIDFEILEEQNLKDDKDRTKEEKEVDKGLQELIDKVGKTDNDIGSGSKKNGGNLFSRFFGKLFSKSTKDTGELEIELQEIKPEALIDDADGGVDLKEEKKETDKEKVNEKNNQEAEEGNKKEVKADQKKAENKKGKVDKIDDVGVELEEIRDKFTADDKNDVDKNDDANDTGKADAVDDITGVGNELEKIVQNFDNDDDEKKTGEEQKKNSKSKTKSGTKSKKSAQDYVGAELVDLDEKLGEDGDAEEEIPEKSEYVYDPKLHWGTTNLLHSFIYQKGEKYNFDDHGTIRNWFHKKIFGSYSSQEKSRRDLKKAEIKHKKEEEESGRFYGDDFSYKRWEHNAARNWFHDKWYHLKNAHRKSVDRFYRYNEDYNKMPWYKRAIWCVKNPLARIMVNFPSTHFGTQAREDRLERMRKLYRQAISEGIIPKSKLGDLDYDPLTGAEGHMTRASEQKQQAFEVSKLSEEKKTNIDHLKAARAAVLRQLMMINDTKDLVVSKCVSQGEDPKAGVMEYMKTDEVRTALVLHLNGLKRADWEIAKIEAKENKKEMPDESKDPAKNPIKVAEGEEGVEELTKLVNEALGRTEGTDIVPKNTLNKTSNDFLKESNAIEDHESKQSSTTLLNVASIGANSMISYKLGGPALIGTDMALAYQSYKDKERAESKGDTISARKYRAAEYKYAADVIDRIGGMYAMAKGLQGSAAAGTVGFGTIIAGATDVVSGSLSKSHFNDVIKDMEEIKGEQEDKNSRKYKMIDMIGSTAEAEKSGSIGQIVGGVVNAVGGVLMATGALSMLGLIVSVGSMGINMLGDSISEGKKKDKAASNVNIEMGLVERQRALWKYYLDHGGQPDEYSRGITKRAVLMEEGFEKGTRSQAAFQQRISYAQKIADNLNSDKPDPTYEKMVKSLRIEKGEDGVYHMEAIATGLGADSKNIARTFLNSTSDNEFIDVAEKMKRRNSDVAYKHFKNMGVILTDSRGNGTDSVGDALKEIEEKERLKAEAEEKRKKEEEEKKKKEEEKKKQEEEAAKKLEAEKQKKLSEEELKKIEEEKKKEKEKNNGGK